MWFWELRESCEPDMSCIKRVYSHELCFQPGQPTRPERPIQKYRVPSVYISVILSVDCRWRNVVSVGEKLTLRPEFSDLHGGPGRPFVIVLRP
jgi:hypothetical protein